MTTDNRTNEKIVTDLYPFPHDHNRRANALTALAALEKAGRIIGEPTPEQVEAAARAIYSVQRPGGAWAENQQPRWHRKLARAALVAAARAAQGAAPQAESDTQVACAVNHAGGVCPGYPHAAQVHPSSIVDEAALIREAKAEALEEASLAYGSGQLSGIFLGRDDYPKAWLRARAAEYREGSDSRGHR